MTFFEFLDLMAKYNRMVNEQTDSEKAAEQSGQDMNDPVNHPSHYTRGGIECIDAITAAVTDLNGPEAWLTESAIKYLWRWRWKNGLEDLRKAQFYLNRLIARVEAEQMEQSVNEVADAGQKEGDADA